MLYLCEFSFRFVPLFVGSHLLFRPPSVGLTFHINPNLAILLYTYGFHFIHPIHLMLTNDFPVILCFNSAYLLQRGLKNITVVKFTLLTGHDGSMCNVDQWVTMCNQISDIDPNCFSIKINTNQSWSIWINSYIFFSMPIKARSRAPWSPLKCTDPALRNIEKNWCIDRLWSLLRTTGTPRPHVLSMQMSYLHNHPESQ